MPCRRRLLVNTSASFSAHVYKSATHSSSEECARYRCTNRGSPILFTSFNDLWAHAITAHAAPREILPEDDWHSLIYLCPFCQVLISRVYMLKAVHLRTHVDAGHAGPVIAEQGLTGRMSKKLWVIPGFCIFCVHDTSLSLFNRFQILAEAPNLDRNVAGHVQSMTDLCRAPRLGCRHPSACPSVIRRLLLTPQARGRICKRVTRLRMCVHIQGQEATRQGVYGRRPRGREGWTSKEGKGWWWRPEATRGAGYEPVERATGGG